MVSRGPCNWWPVVEMEVGGRATGGGMYNLHLHTCSYVDRST